MQISDLLIYVVCSFGWDSGSESKAVTISSLMPALPGSSIYNQATPLAKPYQVKQVRRVLVDYKLEEEVE